ncbi:MAG TPA: GxGYxYP domain-containing protein [Actinopolymorphaceae bacterium]
MLPSRRGVLGGVAAGLVLSTIGTQAASAAGSGISWPAKQALPRFAAPKRLDVIDITKLSGDEQLLLGTLQGIVNRKEPRIYLIGLDAAGQEGPTTWLESLRVPTTTYDDPMELVQAHRKTVRGMIVYDPEVPDSINVATTLAGLESAVAVGPELGSQLADRFGFETLTDLRGRFGSRIEAYEWQFAELWPRTTHRMLIGLPPQRDINPPPGLPGGYTTLAKVEEHTHDASNRDVYEFDLSDQLGGAAVWVRFDDSFTGDGWGPAVTRVTVQADGQTIADFTPGTADEEPYLFDSGNSQISGGPPQHRFADGGRYFVYQFDPPEGTQSLTLLVDMWNEYTVSVTNTEPERPRKVAFAYLRDYAVANRAMTFWLDPNVDEERALFERILAEVPVNTPYLGWFAQDVAGEFGGTELVSRHNVYVLAADWFENMSVHSGAKAQVSDRQTKVPKLPLENKIYVTYVMSEGDNLQYNEHRLRVLWDNPARGKVPINWTTSPLLKDAARNFLSYFQRTATKNDLLIAGPSGAGYIYPGPWPDETFSSYANQTRRYMSDTGMSIVYVLNRVDGRDVELGEAEARAYVEQVKPAGIFLNWGGTSQTSLLLGRTPLATIRGVGAVDEAQGYLADVRSGWDGSSPAFVALGILAWSLTPQHLVTLTESLGPEFRVVRADQYVDLAKRALS